jgi:hypothetical protein
VTVTNGRDCNKRIGRYFSVIDSEEFDAWAALWDAHGEILAARGIDLKKLASTWAEQTKRKLADPGAQSDFKELCEVGCSPIVLAFLLGIMRFSPELPELWSQVAGPPEQRRKISLAFERTAETVEDAFRDLMKADFKMPSSLTAKGIVPPTAVAESLRFYSRVLNLDASLASEAEARSGEELAKYMLVSYAKKATGRYRDRNIATIIGEIFGPVDYNEVAQRMWRSRNYVRLDKNFDWLTGLLFAAGVVMDARIGNVTNC